MATTVGRQWLLTTRDLEVLTALDRCPLTCEQLLKLSATFARPFTDLRRVRERLQILVAAGRVRKWLYVTADRGALGYHTLSPLGYRILHGDDAPPPPKRAFSPIGIAHQHHTRALADFLVHTSVAAHSERLALTDFYRENALKLAVGDECLYPDSSFRLIEPDGRGYGFFVEVDGGTERVRSPQDLDSWERKLRLYERLQDDSPTRFRVLVVTTRSGPRLDHILALALLLTHNPQRSLFYGCDLPTYLAAANPLRSPSFHDHRGNAISLVPHGPRDSTLPAERLPTPVRGSLRSDPPSPST